MPKDNTEKTDIEKIRDDINHIRGDVHGIAVMMLITLIVSIIVFMVFN